MCVCWEARGSSVGVTCSRREAEMSWLVACGSRADAVCGCLALNLAWLMRVESSSTHGAVTSCRSTTCSHTTSWEYRGKLRRIHLYLFCLSRQTDRPSFLFILFLFFFTQSLQLGILLKGSSHCLSYVQTLLLTVSFVMGLHCVYSEGQDDSGLFNKNWIRRALQSANMSVVPLRHQGKRYCLWDRMTLNFHSLITHTLFSVTIFALLAVISQEEAGYLGGESVRNCEPDLHEFFHQYSWFPSHNSCDVLSKHTKICP